MADSKATQGKMYCNFAWLISWEVEAENLSDIILSSADAAFLCTKNRDDNYILLYNDVEWR